MVKWCPWGESSRIGTKLNCLRFMAFRHSPVFPAKIGALAIGGFGRWNGFSVAGLARYYLGEIFLAACRTFGVSPLFSTTALFSSKL